MRSEDWRPISSAPKNERVLVFACGQQFVSWLQGGATDRWHDDDDEESDFNGMWCVTDNKLGPFALRGGLPSFWQPLPGPPLLGSQTNAK